MLIYDIEELIYRAKQKYSILKESKEENDVQDTKELYSLLFKNATPENLSQLENWIDSRDIED